MKQAIENWKARWKAARTDGCSKSPDLWMHEDCDNHDRDYETHHDEDGNLLTRWQADVRLLKGARKSAPNWILKQTIPMFYFTVVRCFGWSRW